MEPNGEQGEEEERGPPPTHVSGMLYAATLQRTWCQRCTTKAHIPPPFLLSHRAQRGRKPAKRKTETQTRAEAGKKWVPGRRASRGKGKERRSHERNRGSQQPSKGRAQGRGHDRHTAHGRHHTAPKHQRGEYQGDKRKAAPRTTTRTAQTPHTAHTPTIAPTARRRRASAARPEDGQLGEGERLTPDAPHNSGQPPPRRATPACKGARRGAGAGSPRPHRPHPGHTDRGTLAARSRGPAAGGGTAPDTRRPSQRWQTTPPPGTAPHHPRGTQPPQGMQAEGTVLGPHTHTPAPTARRWRTPTARSVGGQSGEGQRLTSDAPHNGGRHPPRGRLSATPTASNAGPQGRTLWGRCWVPTPASTAPGTHGSRKPGCPIQRTGGRGRDSA